MAKDKSNKSKIDDDAEFGKPSEAPSGGDGWKLTEEGKNRLLLFTPLREEEVKAFGKKGEAGEKQKIIVADVVVIDEKKPAKSDEHEDVWVFPAYVQGSLRGFIDDRRVLGRLRWTEDTSGAKSASGGYYWELEDASAKDVEKAREYMRAATDPFRSKKGAEKGGKKKAEAEAEPPAKGKKAKAAPEPAPKKKAKKK